MSNVVERLNNNTLQSMHSASENKPFSWLPKKGFTFNQGPARNSFQKNSLLPQLTQNTLIYILKNDNL
jgi:hypothetical protein